MAGRGPLTTRRIGPQPRLSARPGEVPKHPATDATSGRPARSARLCVISGKLSAAPLQYLREVSSAFVLGSCIDSPASRV
jgi:hypothetical protein